MKCDLCENKAVVYRSSSGHKLCLRCLGKVLERGVRRSISRLGALAPGKKVLVPVTCFNTLASLGFAHLAMRMKRGYGTRITVAIPSSVNAVGIEGEEVVRVRVSRQGKMSAEKAFLYDRAWSLRATSLLRYDAVLFPLTATDGLLLLLSSLFRGEGSLVPVLAEAEEEGGVLMINALLNVEASIITAYAALHGLNGRCSEADHENTKQLLRALRGLGPETEFAYLRVLPLLGRGRAKAVYERVFRDLEVYI